MQVLYCILREDLNLHIVGSDTLEITLNHSLEMYTGNRDKSKMYCDDRFQAPLRISALQMLEFMAFNACLLYEVLKS